MSGKLSGKLSRGSRDRCRGRRGKPVGVRRRRGGFLFMLVLLPVIPRACADGRLSGEERLPGSMGSLEELSAAVLAGLSAADTASLESVRLTESEHNYKVWPELPASAPEVNYPADLAWQNIRMRNRAAVADLLAAYRGRKLELVGAECRGATEKFRSFKVRTDCWATFERDGRQLPPQQLFKHVLNWNGGLKIFRYYEP